MRKGERMCSDMHDELQRGQEVLSTTQSPWHPAYDFFYATCQEIPNVIFFLCVNLLCLHQ